MLVDAGSLSSLMLRFISTSFLKLILTLGGDGFVALVRFSSHGGLVTTDGSFNKESIDGDLVTNLEADEVSDEDNSGMDSCLFSVSDDSNLLLSFSGISLFDESNFFFPVDDGADSGHDENGDHDSKTVNPGMSVLFGVLDHRHINGDTDYGTDGEQFQHEIVQGTLEHAAAGVRHLGVSVVRTKRDFALFVIFGCNSLILV